jgi:hypothetical protein
VGSPSEFEINIPRSAFLTNTDDYAHFPVSLEYLTFYLNSSSHVAGQTYNIGIKEIALRYKHLTTHINLVEQPGKFVIFPNPADGHLLRVSGPFDNSGTLQITSIDGKTVFRGKASGTYSEIPIDKLVTGTYLLQISVNGHTETHRFIKK